MKGDVTVFGTVAGTYVIEDICMDVPHGQTVVIPADKAARSKDLWRGVSSKCLFQLHSGSGPGTAATPPRTTPDDVLQQRLQHYEQRNRFLEEENAQLKERLAEATGYNQKLDAVLAAIQGIPASTVIVQQGVSGTATSSPRTDLADGSAPAFIPSEIKPKEATARIEVKQETAESDVAGAAGRLRKLRQGAGS
jgi:hypothetical protein